MEKLRECPLCGGEAKFGINKSCCGKTVRIDCTNPQCGANINAYSSKAEAAKVWNRRPAPEKKAFENCHIYEPGENVQTIAPGCEVLISGSDLLKLIRPAPENKALTCKGCIHCGKYEAEYERLRNQIAGAAALHNALLYYANFDLDHEGESPDMNVARRALRDAGESEETGAGGGSGRGSI